MVEPLRDAPIAVSPSEVTYNRDAWIVVDLAAITHNIRALAAHAAPAELCVVVKADGYGHGAVPVAMAALDAGANMLAVALVDEGITLRDASIDAPVLLLSEPPLVALDDVVAHGLTPTIYRPEAVDAAQVAARRAGTVLDVHVKVDTGMHRVGAAPDDVVPLVRRVADAANLRMAGICTHFAVADEPGRGFTTEQCDRFDAVVADVRRAGLPTGVVHAANSAATMRRVGMHDLVRCGIAVYGLPPGPAVDDPVGLRPALSLRARVSYVKRVAAGEGLSYGLRHRLDVESVIATVPLGYADGVRRALGDHHGQVLIGGRRRRIAGTVTMDQLLVDCGADDAVAVGDEVVLLGRQGDARIDAQEWARRLDTITYEVVCGFSPRLPRFHEGLHGS